MDVKADPSNKSSGDMVSAQIKECGDRVRDLKSKKAEKVHQKFDYLFTHTHISLVPLFLIKTLIDAAVKELLNLKAAYKAETGVEWSPNTSTPSGSKSSVDIKADPNKKTEKVCVQ